MLRILLSDDMYEVLARHIILDHDCVRVCGAYRYLDSVPQVSWLRFVCVSAWGTRSSLIYETATHITG